MKKLLLIALLFTAGIIGIQAQSIFIGSESVAEKGGWAVVPQFVEQMGSPYLMAHVTGIPVEDGKTKINVEKPGNYYMWARTRNWVPGNWEAPGRFLIGVDGKKPENELGKNAGWNWENAGIVNLKKGKPVKFPEAPRAMDVAKNYSGKNGEWQWQFSRNDLSQIEDAGTIRDHMFWAIYGSFYNYKNPTSGNLNTDTGQLSAIDNSKQQQKAGSFRLEWALLLV